MQFDDSEASATLSNRADSGESEDAKAVEVELRAFGENRIAKMEVDCDASMRQFFSKLRVQRFDSDELIQLQEQCDLVLVTR